MQSVSKIFSNTSLKRRYYHTCYFPQLKEDFPNIVKRIREYFEKDLKELIPFESYIIDFAVLEDRIMVIELNPFSIATDPALFSWKEDKEILESGPFCQRITEKPLAISKGVEMAIQELLQE